VLPSLNQLGAILVIGEAPGTKEDLTGQGFVGQAGKTLNKLFAAYGLASNQFNKANIIRCRPPHNRKPLKNEIDCCLSYLANFIYVAQPKVIVTIGAVPTKIFFGSGSLYSKIKLGLDSANWGTEQILSSVDKVIIPSLNQVKYVVPTPHTSPLAFNRFCPDGRKWSEVAQQQIACAISLNAQ
jgi:DNA polymerase